VVPYGFDVSDRPEPRSITNAKLSASPRRRAVGLSPQPAARRLRDPLAIMALLSIGLGWVDLFAGRALLPLRTITNADPLDRRPTCTADSASAVRTNELKQLGTTFERAARPSRGVLRRAAAVLANASH